MVQKPAKGICINFNTNYDAENLKRIYMSCYREISKLWNNLSVNIIQVFEMYF